MNEYFSKNGLQFSPDVELATTDMILPAVRYNMGIGFLPEEFAGDDLESGKVFEIDVNETLPERSIILIHDTEYPQSIASKAFQKFLAERKDTESAEYRKVMQRNPHDVNPDDLSIFIRKFIIC